MFRQSALYAACAAALMLAAPQASAADSTLYQKLGGYDAIAAVTDDFLGRLGGSDTFKPFFVGHSTSSMRGIRQHIVDFICEKSGGPCFYIGRTMAESHKGLGITEAQWQESGRLFGETLDKFGVKGAVREEVNQFVGSLKGDIVAAK
jgi:hemoglobin